MKLAYTVVYSKRRALEVSGARYPQRIRRRRNTPLSRPQLPSRLGQCDDALGLHFNGGFTLSRRQRADAARLVRECYIERARQKLPPKIDAFAKALGVTYGRVLISDLRVRWGSCTPKNNLNFNWRIIKAPPFVIDYVIVHKLAHLLEPNHTVRFWNIASVQVPKCEEAKVWLRDNGRMLEEEM